MFPIHETEYSCIVPPSQPSASRSPTQLRPAALLCLFATLAASAQTTSQSPITALVRGAVQHRLQAAKDHHPQQYIVHRIDERSNSTKAIVETEDGDVARLIAIDGKLISPEAAKAEFDRLDTLVDHPELQERRRKSEDKDRSRITHLLSLLPDAFLYTAEGTIGCGTGTCYRLGFAPNPHWTPPDLEANIFRGLAGELWIDQAQEQLVRLDGHFISDIDFGFGFIGRLNKGGTVLLEQFDTGNDDWELTRLAINVTGKAFLFKAFAYHIDEQTSHFAPVANALRYRDAITLLKNLDASSATVGR
jgi:hypothetical protein